MAEDILSSTEEQLTEFWWSIDVWKASENVESASREDRRAWHWEWPDLMIVLTEVNEIARYTSGKSVHRVYTAVYALFCLSAGPTV